MTDAQEASGSVEQRDIAWPGRADQGAHGQGPDEDPDLHQGRPRRLPAARRPHAGREDARRGRKRIDGKRGASQPSIVDSRKTLAMVERVTDRKVFSFLSTDDIENDVAAELFVLEPLPEAP